MMIRKSHSIKRVRKLLQIFSASSRNAEISEMLVFHVEGAPEVSDVWERKIIRLCDGRSVQDLMVNLYSQELSRGGWIVDIGMWKRIFDDQVVRTLHKLAQQGSICLKAEADQVAAGNHESRNPS